ncbi:MAG: lipoate--protein ligase family protein [Lactobacillales bacterium]|jgi:octanoyl-[GcvH]:protein N-octanoyltransferase|nr:lipoate--protein ligase family protein [Lactobacillales bacterium]
MSLTEGKQFHHQTWFVLPIKTYTNALLPFAEMDTLCEYVAETEQPMIQFWQLKNTFILGMKDTRTPDFHKGLQAITQTAFSPVLRNSGGLGVISDDGVLNLCVFFSNKAKNWSIDEAYEWVFQWVKQAFPTLPIKAYEITNSYCPGTYDLSVDGLKIAGLAQRRVKNGISVSLYLSVNGNQHYRGESVRLFYQEALNGEEPEALGYPNVAPEVMTTLSRLKNQELTIDEVQEQLLRPLKNETNIAFTTLEQLPNQEFLQEKILQNLEKMEKRNELLR